MKDLSMKFRFAGLLPVVVDVETGGFNADKDALLELAAVVINIDEEKKLVPGESYHSHIQPFKNANIDPEALKVNGIIPDHPLRFAIDEAQALEKLFKLVNHALKMSGCRRAVLVGHNAFFDLSFLNAAIKRTKVKRNPFHAFTTLDTAALSALTLGETVLAKCIRKAGIYFDLQQAHSALYDTEKTAELFCWIVNHYHALL